MLALAFSSKHRVHSAGMAEESSSGLCATFTGHVGVQHTDFPRHF